MACALDDTLEQLDIEVLGLVSKSQKDKPQLCVDRDFFRVNYESKGFFLQNFKYYFFFLIKYLKMKAKLHGVVLKQAVKLHVLHMDRVLEINTRSNSIVMTTIILLTSSSSIFLRREGNLKLKHTLQTKLLEKSSTK